MPEIDGWKIEGDAPVTPASPSPQTISGWKIEGDTPAAASTPAASANPAAPTAPTLTTQRPRDFWDRVTGVFSEGALGKLLGSAPSEQAKQLAPFDKTEQPVSQTPLLKLTELDRHGTPRDITEGVRRGFIEGVEGFSSPQGVAMLASLGKLGKLRGIGQAFATAAGAGFDASMIGHAVESVPEAKAQWDAGNQGDAARIAVRALVSGALGLSGAVQKGRVLADRPMQLAPLPAPDRLSTQPSSQGGGTPTVEVLPAETAAKPAAGRASDLGNGWKLETPAETAETPAAPETGSIFDEVPKTEKPTGPQKRSASEEHLVDLISDRETAAMDLTERAGKAATEPERQALLRQADLASQEAAEMDAMRDGLDERQQESPETAPAVGNAAADQTEHKPDPIRSMPRDQVENRLKQIVEERLSGELSDEEHSALVRESDKLEDRLKELDPEFALRKRREKLAHDIQWMSALQETMNPESHQYGSWGRDIQSRKDELAQLQAPAETPRSAATTEIGNGWKIEEPEPTAPATSQQAAERGPGWVGNIPTSEIQVDAPRFQFKANVGQGGAGEELRSVKKWDPEKAGVVAVWKDPADGKTYVVNGHHRFELAQRTGAPEMTVRYLDAKDATEARLKGALINIAEGRGESTDAAKIFRDSNLSPEQLQAEGISVKGKLANEGMALSKLSQPIFEDVISGELSPARGAVIGAGITNHSDQAALYDLMKQREKGGKRLTNDQVGELIRLTNNSPQVSETQESLFGTEEMTRSLLPEKAAVSDYVRKQLGTEKKLFSTVSTQAAAEKLGDAGNVIKAGENAQVAVRANQGLVLYDKFSTKSGPIDGILDRAAQSIADGEAPGDVKQRAYRAIRQELKNQLDQISDPGRNQTESSGARDVRGTQELGTGRPLQAGARELDPARAEEVTPPAEKQTSLVSAKDEAESRAIEQSSKDKLLGEQLTSQARSGLPSKPANLKPAETRGLFEEPRPETGSLFDGAPDPVAAAKERIQQRIADETGTAGLGQKQAEGLLADLVTVGRHLIERGKAKFAEWRDAMVAAFGNGVKPHLLRVWKGAKKENEIETGPDFTKRPSLAKNTADFFKPVSTRIKQEGPAGAELARKLTRAQDVGEVMAGKRGVKLRDAGLDQLSHSDRQNLVAALQGMAQPQNAAVQKAFDGIRAVTDDIAREATQAGVQVKVKRTLRPGDPLPPGVELTKRQDERIAAGERVAITYQRPFQGRQNFYPHVIPGVDALKSGAVRKDVLDNIVSTGVRPDTSTAAVMLDEYRKFIDEGGRAKQLEKHLVESGQARDEAEAYMLLQRFRKRAIKRQGSLEYSRTADLPFYDPDPGRVLPQFVTAASMRLAQVREFGQTNQQINKLIRTIDSTGGNAQFVRAAVDRAIGIVNEPDTAAARISSAVRMVQGFKLGLSFIPNATQGALNSLLKSDLASTLAGGKGLMTAEGRRFALESGASLEGVVNEMLRSVGTENSKLGTFLKAVGFTPTEQANRVWAANAGVTYARRMLARLQKDPNDGRALKVLTELGLKPNVLLKLGKIDGDAALVAAKKFSDITQFRGGVTDLPFFATTPLGKVVFQFKTFVYGQTRLMYDELVGELRAGRFGRGLRTLLILATAFPLAGEAISDLRSWIKGKERKTEGLKRYFEDVAQSGALGVVFDMLQAGGYGKAVEFLAGPTLSDIGEGTNAAAGDNKMRALGRYAFQRVPLLGPVLYDRVFPPRPKAPSKEMKRLIGKSGSR